nr:hypothetical protein [uncultured Methanolobus sp.]
MFSNFDISSFYKLRYTVLLVMLVAGLSAMPVHADSGAVPSLPLILEGSVNVGAEAAAAGTEITAELDGKVIGSTTVSSDGVYGEYPGTKLVVTCEPEDYENIRFYVDGIESGSSGADLSNLNPGDTVNIDLEVSASYDSDSDSNTKSSSSSGSSGGIGTSASTSSPSTVSAENEDANVAIENENGKLESTVDEIPVSTEESVSITPEETSGVSSASVIAVTFLVALVVLLGIMKVKGSK